MQNNDENLYYLKMTIWVIKEDGTITNEIAQNLT